MLPRAFTTPPSPIRPLPNRHQPSVVEASTYLARGLATLALPSRPPPPMALLSAPMTDITSPPRWVALPIWSPTLPPAPAKTTSWRKTPTTCISAPRRSIETSHQLTKQALVSPWGALRRPIASCHSSNDSDLAKRSRTSRALTLAWAFHPHQPARALCLNPLPPTCPLMATLPKRLPLLTRGARASVGQPINCTYQEVRATAARSQGSTSIVCAGLSRMARAGS